MGRKIWHILKSNDSKAYPTRFIFFDTETKQKKNGDEIRQLFWFGYAIYNDIKNGVREELYFTDKDEFWDFVDRFSYRGQKLVLIAHNMFFDFMAVGGFGKALNRGWRLKSPPIFDKGLFIARFHRQSGKKGSKSEYLEALNLGNWFKMRLSSMGEVLGFPKLEMPTYSDSIDKWIQYCKRDAEIVERMIIRYIDFLKKHDLGKFSNTIASQAFHAYRHRFMNHKIYIHGDYDVISLERDCYHGGRSEAFYIGEIPSKLYVMDVHSMYPSVMKGHLFPTRLVKYYPSCSKYTLRSVLSRGFLVIADVLVEVDKPIIPKRTERLIAPIGKFRTVLTTPEIEYLLSAGGKILDVYRMSVYEGAEIFNEYVDYFYAMKEVADNKVDYLFVKLFLNSLYGKFGQRGSNWKKIAECDDAEKFGVDRYFDPLRGKWVQVRTYAGIVEESGDRDESYNSFVAVAAHVTGYAWVKLTSTIERVGFENVYYCDTDSIFGNEKAYNRMKELGFLGDKLGQFGLEKVAESGRIYGVKDYSLDLGTKRLKKLKGVSQDSILAVGKDTYLRISGWDALRAYKRLLSYGMKLEKSGSWWHVTKCDQPVALSKNDLDVPTLGELLTGLDIVLEDIENPSYIQLQWPSMAGHIRKGYKDNYVCRIIVKHLKREYKKGVLEPDGVVRPYVLNETCL